MTHKHDEIILKILNEQAIKLGGHIVIYDRTRRKVLFYRRSTTGYRLTLSLDKRGKPLTIRPSDIVFSIDHDGTVIPGDAYGVFAVEEAG